MSDTLTPEQLASEGKLAYQKGEYKGAARSFAFAAKGYASAGDDLSAAEMRNNHSVALLQARDPKGALKAVEGTDIVFANAGDKRRQAMALANQGAAHEALNRKIDAIRAYERAAELFKEIGEHELRAPVLQSLAALQLRAGRHLQGLATMQHGLAEIDRPSPRQNLLKRLLHWLFRLLKL